MGVVGVIGTIEVAGRGGKAGGCDEAGEPEGLVAGSTAETIERGVESVSNGPSNSSTASDSDTE
jgi:hypothetical protein